MNKQPAVYILASQKNGTLYVGVTSDLVKRIWEHKNNMIEGFTNRYSVHQLVWYEMHDTMESAIMREKQLKEWKRKWKIELIESKNFNWQDLYNIILLFNWIPTFVGMTIDRTVIPAKVGIHIYFISIKENTP
ncbi:MAG: GIY-YIG nuclease family protein [Desulfobacterales bacterium]|nr:GIY-YIG nuclease family protein [Desulfobacterales bacterium]